MSKIFVDEMQGNTGTTISIPSGQTLNVAGNLSSTAGSISGTPSFPDGAKVNTIKHTGGTTGLTINSNGYINKPNQPCFRARRTNTAGTTQGFSGNIIFDSKTLDLGNNYTTSNGRFTAPVAGRYFIHYYTSQRSNTSYIGLTVKHNGTLVARDYNELPNISADWVSQQVTIILNMAASDTVRPYMNTGGTNGQSLENEYRGYSIYLLG